MFYLPTYFLVRVSFICSLHGLDLCFFHSVSLILFLKFCLFFSPHVFCVYTNPLFPTVSIPKSPAGFFLTLFKEGQKTAPFPPFLNIVRWQTILFTRVWWDSLTRNWRSGSTWQQKIFYLFSTTTHSTIQYTCVEFSTMKEVNLHDNNPQAL